jgi:uncharacterized membrane protein YgdD (TMEM256/DUF423 family)
MNKRLWLKIIAVSGLLSVVLGAFAAHGLDAILTEQRMQTFQTGVRYQLIHTLALLGLICLPDELTQSYFKTYTGIFWLLGIVLFSGSLYLLVATDITALGMITPLGGTAFIIGWALLFVAAIRNP